MVPEFHIQVDDLPWPQKDYIAGNDPIFAPQSEYLASLQPMLKGIYEQLREQQWTEEECYDYLTYIERYMGFESAWLRHKGWKEQKIQDWNEACAHKELYSCRVLNRMICINSSHKWPVRPKVVLHPANYLRVNQSRSFSR
ncbi:hypothetical protein N7490_007349 [Penicillium lividum]|nr:hypothetical protein N7490_007349 [Penicillium lividum]